MYVPSRLPQGLEEDNVGDVDVCVACFAPALLPPDTGRRGMLQGSCKPPHCSFEVSAVCLVLKRRALSRLKHILHAPQRRSRPHELLEFGAPTAATGVFHPASFLQSGPRSSCAIALGTTGARRLDTLGGGGRVPHPPQHQFEGYAGRRRSPAATAAGLT